MSVYPGLDTYPGTDPGRRVHEQVRVHLMMPGDTEVGPDISADLLSANITRGGDPTPVLTPDVGTLTLTMAGDYSRTMTPAQRVVVMNHTGRRLFTGKVTDAEADEDRLPGRKARTVTTVRAVDAVAELTNTKRYSVQINRHESTISRLFRLMKSAPHLPPAQLVYAHSDGRDIYHRPYIHESDLARHISMVADGSLNGWFVDVDGRVTLGGATVESGAPAPGVYNTTDLVLVDGSTPPVSLAGRPTLSPVRIRRGVTPSDVPTMVTINRYGRVINLAENPFPPYTQYLQVIGTTGPLVNQALALTWGRTGLEVDCAATTRTNPSDPADEQAGELLAEHYAGLRHPHHRPRQVRINAGLHGWPDLDLLSVLDVLVEGVMHRLYVSGITHTITATSWVVDVDLGDTGADTVPPMPYRPVPNLVPANPPSDEDEPN